MRGSKWITTALFVSTLGAGGAWSEIPAAEAAPDAPADPDDKTAPALVDDILNATTDKDAYVDSPRCLRLHKIRGVQVIDERHIAFRTGRDEYFLVQMQHRCPGLTRESAIAYATNSSRVCELDQLHAVIRFGPTSERLGPACAIPGFQEITREQLTVLRDSLRKVPVASDDDS